MKQTTTSKMHVNNITRWKLDTKVISVIESTCFGFLVKLQGMLQQNKGILQLPLNFVSPLMNKYDDGDDCFQFGNGENRFDLDFGLEDILYITGLPIDGMPVTGRVTSDAAQIIVDHLSMERHDTTNMLIIETKPKLKCEVHMEKLRNYSQNVSVFTVGPAVYAKAFIFYNLGTTLLPTKTRTGKPYYLPLLDFSKIDEYAWGAAVLADIKRAMVGKKSKSLCCFSLALTVFALERFSIITEEIVPQIVAPTQHPLFLGWINVIHERFGTSKNTKTAEEFEGVFDDMTVDKVTWTPYSSERLHMPIRFQHQLRIKYAVVPCINFYNIRICGGALH